MYAFAADPDNLPRWAAGLAQSEITREGELLVTDSPMGRLSFRLAPPNAYGILDHVVTLPSGVTVHNPMRIVAHPEGCEVIFTVRQLDLTDEEFHRDTQSVAADLRRLKELTE